jgi:predicted GTPase
VQDLRILKKVSELHKGAILAWNKWDLKGKDHRTFDELVKETRYQYMEVNHQSIGFAGQKEDSSPDHATDR